MNQAHRYTIISAIMYSRVRVRTCRRRCRHCLARATCAICADENETRTRSCAISQEQSETMCVLNVFVVGGKHTSATQTRARKFWYKQRTHSIKPRRELLATT